MADYGSPEDEQLLQKMPIGSSGKLGDDEDGVGSYLRYEIDETRACVSSCYPQAWKWLMLAALLTLVAYSALNSHHISIVITSGGTDPVRPSDGSITPKASSGGNESIVAIAGMLAQLNQSISELMHKQPPPTVSTPTPAPADPSRLTADEWLQKENELPFLLEHGVDTNSLSTGRSRRVSQQSVDLLLSHVQRHRLVEGWDNLLFIGVVNFGYIDMAYSWICFMQRQGFTNFLLGAVDTTSKEALTALGYGAHVISLHSLLNDSVLEACGGNVTHNFLSSCFNKQTQAKSLLVLTSLFAGYDTLLTDMDISVIHNPLLYMPLNHTWEMQLEPTEWNSGWYFSKASAASIRMQHEVLDIYDSTVVLDDQRAYNNWVRAYRHLKDKELKAHLFALSRALFPIGQGDQYGRVDAIIQHNNWLTGADAKRERQRAKGLYLYNKGLTDERLANFSATHSAAGESSVMPESGTSLLVCDECVACKSMVPTVPVLRDSFPGPLKTSNFTLYQAEAPL